MASLRRGARAGGGDVLIGVHGERLLLVIGHDTDPAGVLPGLEVPGWVVLALRRHALEATGMTTEEAMGFGPAVVELTAAIIYAVRRGKRSVPAAPVGSTFNVGGPYGVANPYTPTVDGIRIEQLKNLAALRDSGALTEQEFEAEKRRILNT